MQYLVKLIPEQEGGYSVLVPGLPGCVSQGETREEALQNITEAISEYLLSVEESVEGSETASVTVDVRVA
ncbi:MAG: hypothetical protein QOJ65_787 [Fimbriimonadaceae bacterium]|jgi:predicted RNase H-like HicB family nuclease|nr:hypothetical protein [Fimbriimonadaceae bacterium]